MERNSGYEYCFTVFTPTYNRAHTLPKVYECLKKQTFKDFEWLIVDDGSTDNTEYLVNKWMEEKVLDIRYFKKENGGKLRAFGFAIERARGELFVTIDSDDECTPNALERLKFHWDSIEYDKNEYAGVSVLCKNEKGELIGTRYPKDKMDSNNLEIHTKYRVKGDKWAVYRTDVLKQYPIPSFPGENRVASSIIWNQIGLKYKTRYVNEILLIKEYRDDGITKSSVRTRVKNANGSRYYYQEYIKLPVPFIFKLRNLINYIRFSIHAKKTVKEIVLDSIFGKFTYLFLPIGYVVYLNDIYHLNKEISDKGYRCESNERGL